MKKKINFKESSYYAQFNDLIHGDSVESSGNSAMPGYLKKKGETRELHSGERKNVRR